MGIRTRMTLLFAIILATTLVAFSLVLYGSFVKFHDTEYDIALYNHAVDIAGDLDINEVGEILYRAKPLNQTKIFPFALSQTYMQIRSIDGRVLAKSGPSTDFRLPYDPQDSDLLKRGRDSTFKSIRSEEYLPDADVDDREFRLINFPLDDASPPQLVLQIAAPVTRFKSQLAALRHSLFVYIPIVIFFASVGGFYLSGRTLAPVKRMIDRAHELSPDKLSERLPVPFIQDEIQKLALTLNQLLDRLEAAFSSQERFVADASHQLLTPLAILRGELDLVNREKPEEMKAFLESASQEIDHLAKTVNDMLLLARADAGVSSLSQSTLALDEILLEAFSRVDKVATQKGIKLRFNIGSPDAGPAMLKGDRDLLLVVFYNLIENATKYSPPGAVVEVLSTVLDDHVRVEITDQGPGIDPAEIDLIFERFYRGTKASHKTQGVGLGLAISKRIIELHGGDLSVSSVTGGGTRFTILLKTI